MPASLVSEPALGVSCLHLLLAEMTDRFICYSHIGKYSGDPNSSSLVCIKPTMLPSEPQPGPRMLLSLFHIFHIYVYI